MRSAMLYDAGCEDHHQPHFLEACFLCNKPIGSNKDIFMYRGNTAFCSKECRQEQIEIDEKKEKKRWKLYSSSSAGEAPKDSTSSPSKTVRTGSVQVA